MTPDKSKDKFGQEIMCKRCDTSAYEFFQMNHESVPEYFYNGMVWYCSEQCYNECTEDE